MKIKRIVANVETSALEAARSFYADVLGLEVLMDHGCVMTLGSRQTMQVQISFATEGGSGTPVPDISIEVDDLDEAIERIEDAGIKLEYGPVEEPWGVRRFYVHDPLGRLVNIMVHIE